MESEDKIDKPGPELDRAVAKAIGIQTSVEHNGAVLVSHREWDEIRGIEHPTCEGDIACLPFSPSTDLNAAFTAAAKANLFGDGVCLLMTRGGSWRIWDDEAYASQCIAEAPTPALAICAAILKLKTRETHEP